MIDYLVICQEVRIESSQQLHIGSSFSSFFYFIFYLSVIVVEYSISKKIRWIIIILFLKRIIAHFIPIVRILKQLLTVEGVRSLPTIAQLLEDPYFSDIDLGLVEKGSFKVWKSPEIHTLDNRQSMMSALLFFNSGVCLLA